MNNIPHDRKPHPHQHVINAWAEGKPIQYRFQPAPRNHWVDVSPLIAPSFTVEAEYRIKPDPKLPYSLYAQVYSKGENEFGTFSQFISPFATKPCDVDNVEFIFDGDTHELIDVNRRATHP